jgi:cation transport ATPase
LLGKTRPFGEGLGLHARHWADQFRVRPTAIFVAIDGKTAGILGIADPIKATTPDALQALRDVGVTVVMLTGDNWTTPRAVANHLGISEVVGKGSPDEYCAGFSGSQNRERDHRRAEILEPHYRYILRRRTDD